jgi:hypothetical protein
MLDLTTDHEKCRSRTTFHLPIRTLLSWLSTPWFRSVEPCEYRWIPELPGVDLRDLPSKPLASRLALLIRPVLFQEESPAFQL